MPETLAGRTSQLPKPFDPAHAARTLAALAEGPDGYQPPRDAHAALEAIFGNSPFLARLALRERAFLHDLIAQGPEAALGAAEAMARGADGYPTATSLPSARAPASRTWSATTSSCVGQVPIR